MQCIAARPTPFLHYALALNLAQELMASEQDRSLPLAQHSFAYMPYTHSVSTLIHEQAVALFSQLGMEDTLRFELQHRAIIDGFGRYPHRNAILGRNSTAENLVFLVGRCLRSDWSRAKPARQKHSPAPSSLQGHGANP